MLQLALKLAVDNGFVPTIPPVLVRPEVMVGTGFLGAHAEEVYRVEGDGLYLVGTSEVPLAGITPARFWTFPRAAAVCGLVVVFPT